MSGKPENTALLDGRVEAGLATSELIGRFEADIKCDCHSSIIAFNRSFAQQELCRRGRSALPEIVAHLKEGVPGYDALLQWVWCLLLSMIESSIDSEYPVPESLHDIRGWTSWAEKLLETAPVS